MRRSSRFRVVADTLVKRKVARMDCIKKNTIDECDEHIENPLQEDGSTVVAGIRPLDEQYVARA